MGACFGKCECGQKLKPVYFLEKEFVNGEYTNRERIAISYLLCDFCGNTECVDNSFDDNWD